MTKDAKEQAQLRKRSYIFIMNQLTPEQLTMLATAFAANLSDGKPMDEVIEIKNILHQVVQSLNTIIAERNCGRFKDKV